MYCVISSHEFVEKFDKLIERCGKNQNDFLVLKESLTKLHESTRKIFDFASIYDFDEKTPGNGFRSFIHVSLCAVDFIDELCEDFEARRSRCIFSNSNLRNLNTSIALIQNLNIMSEILLKVHQNLENGNLFEKRPSKNLLIEYVKNSNFECYFDLTIGFQYEKGIKQFSALSASRMLSFYDYYNTKGCKLMNNDLWYFWRFAKYLSKPELRSVKMKEMILTSDINFIKSLWSIPEENSYKYVIKSLLPSVTINEVIEIQVKPLKFFNIEIPTPKNTKFIRCRLISSKKRSGMNFGSCTKCFDPSKSLIFHLHSGGFISGSSESEEVYLRDWAIQLDIPIISVDYSLAPEAKFPVAVEEIFYAYCWILANFESLGTTGENIIFCGMSAGAILAANCIIKCIEMKIPVPKSFASFYGVFNLGISQNPSKFIIDPFIPCPFAIRLLKSYAGDELIETPDNELEIQLKNFENYNFSPYYAPSEILRHFPKTILFTTIVDNFCDDSVEFAKKLKMNGVEIELKILGAIPHGFLMFTKLNNECQNISEICVKIISDFIK